MQYAELITALQVAIGVKKGRPIIYTFFFFNLLNLHFKIYRIMYYPFIIIIKSYLNSIFKISLKMGELNYV